MPESPPRLALHAETAADLMTANPVSVREDATLREALGLLIDKGYSAAPVIDRAGRPVGVLSRSDLLVHDRETAEHLRAEPEFYHKSELKTRRRAAGARLPGGEGRPHACARSDDAGRLLRVAGGPGQQGGRRPGPPQGPSPVRRRRQWYPRRRHFRHGHIAASAPLKMRRCRLGDCRAADG